MFITERKLPEELLHYKALKYRCSLDKDLYERMRRLERGAKGERIYDLLFDEAGHQNLYIFRDIYLQIEGSVTQYDALIISENGIIVNEIKNFTGDYEVSGDSWFGPGGVPLPDDAPSQLRRAVGKLLRLKRGAGFDFEVAGKLVFVNERFRLFSRDEELWRKVVLLGDLDEYFRSFQNEYSGEYASKIADMIEGHIVANPYFKLGVEFGSARHGLYCGGCGSFRLEKQHYHFLCTQCGSRESNETHIVRAMSDFKYLFSDTLMTTKRMMEFTGRAINARSMQRYLNKYCYAKGNFKSTHYVFKYYDFDQAMNKEQPGRKYLDYIN